jgi:hypothetical protein
MHDVLPTVSAYLDLGAGSMLLQMILAGILGVSFTIKTYWKRIVRRVRRETEDEGTMPQVPPPDDRR